MPSKKRKAGPNHSRWARVGRKCTRAADWVRLLASRPRLMLQPAQYLFIFSHMRSRSTLLSHILGSHPEISGYLETHIAYKSKLDFMRLRAQIADALDSPRPRLGRYIMDKVLHNWYIEPALAERMGVLAIFLVRRPDESIKSLCEMMKNRQTESVVHDALTTYLKRMQWMQNCCPKLSQRPIFVESGSLVNDTASVFKMLQERLELSSPLTENYQIFKTTGRRVFGDFSQNIKAGKIIREGTSDYSNVPEIPAEVLAKAQEAYERCVAVLKNHCTQVESRAEPSMCGPSLQAAAAP